MITSEQITEILNSIKLLSQEFITYRNRTDTLIAQLQYDMQQLLVHQTALTDKIHYLQKRVDDPLADQNQHDTVGEHRADKILSNPIMDRQEYPQGMREWEVIKFKAIHNNLLDMTLRPDGKYENDNCEADHGLFTINEMIHGIQGVADGSYSIHSVRRLSDGEVFTVGDKEVGGVIKGFKIINNIMVAEGIGVSSISLWKKSAQLFTTADGAVVLEGYNIWFMHPKNWPTPTVCKAQKGLNWENHYSTKEAAEAAYKAAVLFTTADGVAIFNEETEVWSWNDMNIFSWQLKYLLDPARSWYSTRAAAEVAYEKWLYEQPVLTGNDIRNLTSRFPWGDLEKIVKNKLAKS